MGQNPHGELVPVGGGDSIPLRREKLVIGRRESCDIRMPYPNISSVHCELTFKDGYWYVQDKNSTNGTKVNGTRVLRKVLIPNDEVSIGKRKFTIHYTLPSDRRLDEIMEEEDIMSQSLLERAGLEKGNRQEDEEDDLQWKARRR
jgi:adenylate cyclase